MHSCYLYAGPAKLGTPYRPDPSYIEYFVQFTNTNDLENCKIHPEVLSIESHKLEIIVDNVRRIPLLHGLFFLFFSG